MRLISAIFFLCFTTLASASDALVSMTYGHSMRIPHSRVQVVIDAKGALTVETDSRGKDRKINRIQLPLLKFQQMKRELGEIDWKKVSSDKTIGLDGSSVRISSGDHSASLWSPEYDSKKRGLVQIQNLIENIFDAAGLDRTGMPEKKAEQDGGGQPATRSESK